MFSTPPAMNTEPSPARIAWAALTTACRPEPHRRFTVWPGTSTGKPGEQRRHPGDVAVVLARLIGAAEDHVLDACRRNPGALDHGANRNRREIVGPNLGQRAAGSSHRGA